MPKINLDNFLEPPSTEISPFLAKTNQLVVCNGVNPHYKLGTITKDTGYYLIGSALESGKNITGLYHFRQNASTSKILATCNDSGDSDMQLFYSTGSSWTEITDAETAWSGLADAEVDMEGFIGYCFFVGYDPTNGFLPVASLTDTTFSTSDNVTDMPQAKFITRYRSRLYVANCKYSGTEYPYRVYYSDIPSGGSLSWSPSTNFFDVDFSEEITGLTANWGKLIAFTEYSAYSFDQYSRLKMWDIGCSNHNSIGIYGTYVVWANKDNIWMSDSGFPTPIGNPIWELFKRSDSSQWRATVIDDEYHLYLGATKANGIDYNNCVVSYSFNTQMWRWRELGDAITKTAKVRLDGDDYLFLGTSQGEVMLKTKYTDTTPIYNDNGAPIYAHFRTPIYDFDDPSTTVKINRLVAYMHDAQGVSLRYRLVDKNQEQLMPFQEIGELRQVVNDFQDLSLEGYFIQFEIKEYSDNYPFSFYGLLCEYKNTGSYE